jgi:hypothetical protein
MPTEELQPEARAASEEQLAKQFVDALRSLQQRAAVADAEDPLVCTAGGRISPAPLDRLLCRTSHRRVFHVNDLHRCNVDHQSDRDFEVGGTVRGDQSPSKATKSSFQHFDEEFRQRRNVRSVTPFCARNAIDSSLRGKNADDHLSPAKTKITCSRQLAFIEKKNIRERRSLLNQLLIFGVLYIALFLFFTILVHIILEEPLPFFQRTLIKSPNFLRFDTISLPRTAHHHEPRDSKARAFATPPPPDQPPTFVRRCEALKKETVGDLIVVPPALNEFPSSAVAFPNPAPQYVHKDRVVKDHFFPTAAYSRIEIFSDNSIGGILWISLAHTTLVSESDIINATADNPRTRKPMRDYTRGFYR